MGGEDRARGARREAGIEMLDASPKKLKSGDWGALVKSGSVKAGDAVEITTKAGKSWKAFVTHVFWTGDGVAICATDSCGNGPALKKKAPKKSKVTCKYCGCDDPTCGGKGVCQGPAFDPCFDCAC